MGQHLNTEFKILNSNFFQAQASITVIHIQFNFKVGYVGIGSTHMEKSAKRL